MEAIEVPWTVEYMGGQLNAALILEDFQNSPDDEEDTRSIHEYLNDLEEEYQARALLVKSKRFFKKGTQRFSSIKTTDQTECHKSGKKGYFARDCWLKTSVSTYQSPFQPKPLSSPQHKPELRPTKDIEEKYNKVKAKLALLISSDSASKAPMINNKGLIPEAYEWDEEEVSSDDNEMVEVKVLMALAEENDDVSKEGTKNDEWVKISIRKCISEQIHSQKKIIPGVDQLTEDPSSLGQNDLVFIKSLADDTKVTIPGVERPWLSKVEGFILPNHDIGRILPAESQRDIIDPLGAVTDSSATDYDSTDESLVYSTPLPLLKKLDGAEPISRSKTIKSSLNSKSTFKAEALKGVILNELSSSPATKTLQLQKFTQLLLKADHRTYDHAEYNSTMNMSQHLKSLERSIQEILNMPSKDVKLVVAQIIPQLIIMILNGSKECDIRKPIWYLDSRCSRHMTGVKSYLHKYVEQPGPKVVFGDDSTCTTKGYGSIKCNGIVFTKVAFISGLKYNLISISQLCDAKYSIQFDEKKGTIFNSNKEIVMNVPQVRDVYVLDMTYSAQESCFFAKAFDNLNWLWNK
ncbi:hypothetical protein Tco_0323836 [Tanacetum coccineum]